MRMNADKLKIPYVSQSAARDLNLRVSAFIFR